MLGTSIGIDCVAKSEQKVEMPCGIETNVYFTSMPPYILFIYFNFVALYLDFCCCSVSGLLKASFSLISLLHSACSTRSTVSVSSFPQPLCSADKLFL